MRRLAGAALATALVGLLAFATSSPAGGATCKGFFATIQGTSGNNQLLGTSGVDVIAGLGGNDVILGFESEDLICGGTGNDYIEGNGGPDVLSGDKGYDNLAYPDAPGPVGVSLVAGTASGAEGQDELSGFEAVIGSDFGDVLGGGPGFNSLEGREGNDDLNGRGGIDLLRGGVGSDVLVGGEGSLDIVYFFDSPIGVEADLEEGVAVAGTDEDTLISIEGLVGSEFPDTLRGDAGENVIGGAEGDDTLDGRGSFDFVLSFGRFPDDPTGPDAFEILFGGPHTIDLAAETATDAGDASEVEGDSVIDFEGAAGGYRDDVLLGTDQDNVLAGEPGDDQILGRGGDDAIDGGTGEDIFDGGPGPGDQIAYFQTSGVKANLATGLATAQGDTDQFEAVEEIVGSEHADVLVGDSGSNVIAGLGGNDRIAGGGGDDILFGKPIPIPLGDLEGAPGEEAPATDVGPAKLLDGGSGSDVCNGSTETVRCEALRLTDAAKEELSSIIQAIQDIKRRRGVRLG